jgi:hypothetical protein
VLTPFQDRTKPKQSRDRRERLDVCKTLLFCALALAGCTSPRESGIKVIVGARLEAIPYSVIVVANGKIAAVGSQAEVPVPKGAAITRGTGKIVIFMPINEQIAPGEPANLVLQDAATGSIQMVMRDGEWVK